jgi:hypothetical protein
MLIGQLTDRRFRKHLNPQISPHHTFQSARKIDHLAGSQSFDLLDLVSLLLGSGPEILPRTNPSALNRCVKEQVAPA